MNQEELTKAFMMISNFGLQGFYKKIQRFIVNVASWVCCHVQ